MPINMEMDSQQVKNWHSKGKHILAQYDDDSIIVYQAYNPSIGNAAIENGVLCGDFSYTRMSWIKTNFLWMMFRFAWGTSANQEITLGFRISRLFFNSLLEQAVASSCNASGFASEQEWKRALGRSSVRLQWDPDHHPSGAPQERRAVQLGLRGEALASFGRHELLEIVDLTAFVAEQRSILSASGIGALRMPSERVYSPPATVAANIGL